MLGRNAVILAPLIICSACAGNQTHNAVDTLPDSKVANIEVFSGKGVTFNERHFALRYFDGTEVKWWSIPNSTHGRIMPGRHTLGVKVKWGDFCLGFLFGSVCTNWCYSGLVLEAEAGRKYSYDIEKNKDEVNVVVSDDTGAVAAQALCEKYSGLEPDSSTDQVIKSINERIERESKEPEIQDKAE